MYRLASIELAHNNVLIVEADQETSLRMSDDVARSGGSVVATVPDISAMLAVIDGALRIDSVMADAQTLAQAPVFVPEWLRGKGIKLVVVASWDDWFLCEADGDIR
jgi:hypothetical protein